MTETKSGRPKTVLIAAMGGEGGGVLANWLVVAATKAGRRVHSTSIPGVAQRTGATTYYVEVWPDADAPTGEASFALYPTPGEIDVMVASELIEAGRALQNGFVSPDRTVLVASTHRVFAMNEKTAMADGRFDAGRVTTAAKELARRSILVDLEAASRATGAAINAVMLGAIAGAGELPLAEQSFRDAIRDEDKAVDANLAGFESGLALSTDAAPSEIGPVLRGAPPTHREKLLARARALEPRDLREIVVEGVKRLIDYQDAAYARRYLDHVESIVESDPTSDRSVTRETARQLALQMSYEDVIRVAQLKARPDRMARIRAEVGAAPGEPMRVMEFLKPGVRELCALMPGPLARPILGWAARRGLTERLHIGLKVNSASISGFLALKMLSWMRPLRRLGYRFGEDRRRIDRWLSTIRASAPRNPAFALEIAETARLIKGYGETFDRGLGNYERIRAALIEPTLSVDAIPGDAVERLARAREAALADPDGEALETVLFGDAPRQEAAPVRAAQ